MASTANPPLLTSADNLNVLRALELDQPLTREAYQAKLEKWQSRLNLLSRNPGMRGKSVVAVFEGNDAAGKGGAIRRITGALDARVYWNISVAAPTEEERAQPDLWRFWRHIMVRHDVVVVKFWLAIGKEVQFKRFKLCEKVAFKRFKITEEDWRNRKKWDAYEEAVCDMVDRTSTTTAPWTMVEENNKYYARIKVLKTLCEALEKALAPGRERGGKKKKKG